MKKSSAFRSPIKFLKRQYYKHFSNRIVPIETFRLLAKAGKSDALRYLSTRGSVDQKLAVGAFVEATLAENDEVWLSNLNNWLGQIGAKPITLNTENASRFHRITSLQLQKIADDASQPLVSIIMTAHNASPTLRIAANSILQQTWRNIELLIVDDASTDETAKIISELSQQDKRVRPIINTVNVGTYASKNRALKLTKGDYISGHDADDLAVLDRIESQMRRIGIGKTATAGNMVRLNESGIPHKVWRVGQFSCDGFRQRATISLLLKREVIFSRLGYWDSVRFAADAEYFARAARILGAQFDECQELTMFCLSHGNNLTSTADPQQYALRTKARNDYKIAWKNWHAATKSTDLMLEFPNLQRRFAASPLMSLTPSETEYLQSIVVKDSY